MSDPVLGVGLMVVWGVINFVLPQDIFELREGRSAAGPPTATISAGDEDLAGDPSLVHFVWPLLCLSFAAGVGFAWFLAKASRLADESLKKSSFCDAQVQAVVSICRNAAVQTTGVVYNDASVQTILGRAYGDAEVQTAAPRYKDAGAQTEGRVHGDGQINTSVRAVRPFVVPDAARNLPYLALAMARLRAPAPAVTPAYDPTTTPLSNPSLPEVPVPSFIQQQAVTTLGVGDEDIKEAVEERRADLPAVDDSDDDEFVVDPESGDMDSLAALMRRHPSAAGERKLDQAALDEAATVHVPPDRKTRRGKRSGKFARKKAQRLAQGPAASSSSSAVAAAASAAAPTDPLEMATPAPAKPTATATATAPLPATPSPMVMPAAAKGAEPAPAEKPTPPPAQPLPLPKTPTVAPPQHQHNQQQTPPAHSAPAIPTGPRSGVDTFSHRGSRGGRGRGRGYGGRGGGRGARRG